MAAMRKDPMLTASDLQGYAPDELACNQCAGGFCSLRYGTVVDGKPLIMCSRKDEVKKVIAALSRE